MEAKPLQTRVVPESALLHFAFSQRQYIAVLNAVQFFARKLVDPAHRHDAMSALAVLQAPSGFSLPSEAEEPALHEPTTKEVMPTGQSDEAQRVERAPETRPQVEPPRTLRGASKMTPPGAATGVPRGLGALKGGKK